MPCAHPIPAVRPLFGGRVSLSGVREVRQFGSRADSVLADARLLLLPCGSCVGCQISRARSWAIRCALEQQLWPVCSFVTLTYSERYAPPTLERSALSWFFKRLRKQLPPKGLRFFACGEYGETTRRPHYHALLFGVAERDLVERAWGRGFATVEAVTPGRIAYTAGYCAKKVGMFEEAGERVDRSTGEVYRHQPPFLQMSRRPGIGGHVRQHWRSWRRTAVWSGQEVPVPRFLHASYKEHASVSELADLEREKLEERLSPTIRELDASEAIAAARVSLKSSRRTL